MSADTKNISSAFADRLANFDEMLRATTEDVDILTGVQDSIGSLLADYGDSEGEIRRVLEERYKTGEVRRETFQLVESVLDEYVTEQIPTSPVPAGGKRVSKPSVENVAYEKTVVIDAPAVEKTQAIDEVIDVVGTNSAASISAVDFDLSGAERERAPEIVGKVEPIDQADTGFGATAVIPDEAFAEAASAALVQVGTVLRDRFLLQQEVKGGSMGVVYKALDRRLAEAGSNSPWVAIKILSPKLAENGDALRALQQEATKGRCLTHPNIVRFIDLDRDGDLHFIVMEWLEGRTLADILDSEDRDTIDHATAFRLIRQIGEALAYAHRCGIVHADVKPANVMILPDGNAKLFDFGVARAQQHRTRGDFDPGVLGAMTPAYSSMQVLTGDEPMASDDVFSLGCLLYRLVAGYRVFGPRNAAEASEEGMKPQRVDGLSDGQWRALKKALSYSRVTRFGSVQEFLDALDDHAEETLGIEVPERFVEESGGGIGKTIFAVLLLLSAAGFGAWRLGYLDPYLEQLSAMRPAVERTAADDVSSPAEPVVETPEVEDVLEEAPPAEFVEASEPMPEAGDPDTVGPLSDLVDFSQLPAPDMVIPISPGGALEPALVILREDGADLTVEFLREGDLSSPLMLRLEEVGFSGNRSPWAAGQYALSNAGEVGFPVGQDRARITLTTTSDPLREADQQSTLRLREVDNADSAYALLEIELQDDDQRAFEASLPSNTVAFAASQASIRETDPAVQIDVIRFNPDDSPMQIAFTVGDVTATEGEDYFAPGAKTISFGPGQRSARILIPLVQDSRLEEDEAFFLELVGDANLSAIDVYRRIVIMIRDDETPPL